MVKYQIQRCTNNFIGGEKLCDYKCHPLLYCVGCGSNVFKQFKQQISSE